jgi:hypothetical protein
MAIDQEAVERFDRLDRQIAAWCAVIAANSKAVADMQVAFGELKARSSRLYVPSWLTGRMDAVA